MTQPLTFRSPQKALLSNHLIPLHQQELTQKSSDQEMQKDTSMYKVFFDENIFQEILQFIEPNEAFACQYNKLSKQFYEQHHTRSYLNRTIKRYDPKIGAQLAYNEDRTALEKMLMARAKIDKFDREFAKTEAVVVGQGYFRENIHTLRTAFLCFASFGTVLKQVLTPR